MNVLEVVVYLFAVVGVGLWVAQIVRKRRGQEASGGLALASLACVVLTLATSVAVLSS